MQDKKAAKNTLFILFEQPKQLTQSLHPAGLKTDECHHLASRPVCKKTSTTQTTSWKTKQTVSHEMCQTCVMCQTRKCKTSAVQYMSVLYIIKSRSLYKHRLFIKKKQLDTQPRTCYVSWVPLSFDLTLFF